MKLRLFFFFSEVNTHSASQEIPRLLWNPKVHYCVHKSPPLDTVLSQMHSVHTLSPYFPEIHSNFIFSSTPRSLKLSLPFRFADHNFTYILISPMRAICSAHLILLDLITLLIFGETYKL